MNFEVLKKYSIKAKKSLGQNFLIDDNILNSISKTLDIAWENILEIGPGYWSLTEKLLLQKPKGLHLVELDKEMIEIIWKRIENSELVIDGVDFQIFKKDILKFEPEFKNEKYYVIANIPYYITSPILKKFLYNIENKPEKMLILMQKDVGDKILAWQNFWDKKINSKWKSSVLSLFVAKKSYVRETIKVPAKSFIPAPKVESSVLLFETHDNYSDINDTKFLELIKKWFAEPRKKLVNNLVKWWFTKENVLGIFKTLWFIENTRWEDLSIDEWIELYKNISV